MVTSSSAQDVVCPGCKFHNPPGTSACVRCQRFLGPLGPPRQARQVSPSPKPPVVQPTVASPSVVAPAPTGGAVVNPTRAGAVVQPPVKSPLVPTGPRTSRPEDGTTRYLCAAAHRHSEFSDGVIEGFLLDEVRAVPPSPGLDSAAVLRDAVAARARRRRRDALVLAQFALLALLAPIGALLWVAVGLVSARNRPTGGQGRRRIGGVLETAAAAALLVAVPVATATIGFGTMPTFIGATASALLTAGILLVLGADQFAVHRLVRERFQAGEFEPDFRDARDGWERGMRSLGHARFQAQLDRFAAADEHGAQAANHADVIVHRGPSPFIGAGLPLETQSIALPLEADPARPQGTTDINVTDLHAHVAAALVSLSSASSLVPGMRLEGILHREQVLIPTAGLIANMRSSLGAAALKALDQPPARHVSFRAARTLAEHPLEWARYYSCFRVESWNRDLATTCYFYAGTDQQMLYLELTHCILPPITSAFQEIDYVVEFGEGPVCGTARELLRLPVTVLARLSSLARRMAPHKQRGRGVDPDRYGASLSLREHVVGDTKPPSYFLKSDATRYVKIVDTKLFTAVGDYLKRCGYDVAEFQRAVRTTITQNNVNIAGGNFTASNFQAGSGNTATTNAGGGSQHP